MVLGLKPMGKLIIFYNHLDVRQSQSLAWSSDSNLWGKLINFDKYLNVG